MNSPQYFFILGSNPTISIAEIISLFNIDQDQAIVADNFLITTIETKVNPQTLMSILGGSVKIGIINSQTSYQNFKLETDKLIKSLTINPEKKLYFGFSVYAQQADKLIMAVKKVGGHLKNELNKQQIKARWVTAKEPILSSVIVKKNKLISDHGVEWCLLRSDTDVFIGQTLAVQEFEQYSQRDYGRPASDSLSGMLPPKLARMMINIASGDTKKEKLSLLDPFCGSGTVLQEAMMLNIKNLSGSDLSGKAVNDSEQNLQWLASQNSNQINWQVIKHDAQHLTQIHKSKTFDLIVCEPYLGPPLRGSESEETIEETISELSDLYLSVFQEFKTILKDKGRVCMVWPIFIYQQQQKFLPIYDKVVDLGFQPITIFDNQLKKNTSMQLSDRDTMIYSRTGQKIYREIVIFNSK